MKKSILLLLMFILSKSIFSQSPFVQSNSNQKGKQLKIDTVNVNFLQKLNTLSKTVTELIETPSNLSDSFNMTNRVNEFKKTLEDKTTDYDETKKSRDLLENQVALTKRSLAKLQTQNNQNSKLVASLKANIANLENQIKDFNQRLDKDEKDKKELQTKIEQISFEEFKLKNEIIGLQAKEFDHKITEVNAAVSELEKSVSTLQQNLKKREWRVKNKTLSDDDETTVLDYNDEMISAANDAVKDVADLKASFDELNNNTADFRKVQERIEILVSLDNNEAVNKALEEETTKAKTIKQQIDNKIQALDKNIATKKKSFETFEKTVDKNQKEIAKIYEKYKVENEETDDDLKTIAGITQPLSNQGQLVPNISLLGFKSVSDENSSLSAQLKLFVGANTQSGNSINNNYKLYIPEASTYGFMADFSLGFIPSNKTFRADASTKQPIKRLGINLGAYYLGKTLNRLKDTSNFNIGLLQFKTGMQYVLIGNVLSVYANVNPFFVSNGVADFKTNYEYKKGLRSFVDFGLECYLNLVKEANKGGLFLDFDLGFISAGRDVRELSPGDDPLIPRIKISLVKGFKF